MIAEAPYVASKLDTECWFPACDQSAVTQSGMCDAHRRVAVSSTGSWLEAG